MKILSVANQKGGVGKTTTAINLSYYIAYFGRKILLVDFDPQSNATSGLGINNNKHKTIYHTLIDEENINNIIINKHSENLFIVPSSIDLIGFEVEFATDNNKEFILKNTLNKLKREYDYVIIDCPPSLGLLTLNAIVASNSVIIPVQCEYYALEGISKIIETIDLINVNLNTDVKIEGILLTMFDSRTNISYQVEEEMRNYFKDLVFKTIIPRNVRLSEAPSFGLPIHLYAPKSKGAVAYMKLAEEFLSNEAKSIRERA